MAIQDVIKRLIYQFSSTGADKVADDIGKVNTEQTKLAAGTPQVTKASLDLSKSFENLERRFDSTIRAQQDYQRVQDKVNAAVAQNPALQERANSVLARAAEHFDRAGKATTAYAGAVETARGAALGLAAGIGPLGAVLGSFGPWGIAAAAGIGLVANAFSYLSENAAKIGDASVNLQKLADNTGLTTKQLRGLGEAGDALGITEEAIGTAIQKFTVNLAAARDGSGDLYEKLRGIDKSLADQVASTRSGGEALNILAKAYNSTTDATEKASIAVAAFGRAGVSVGKILEEIGSGGGLDAYSTAAEKALGVTAEWTDRVAKLRKENKDLTGDLELIKASFYTEEMLTRQNEALRIQKEMALAAKATREAMAKGEEPTMFDFLGTGNVVPLIQNVTTAVEQLTEAKKNDTAATQANTAAQNANALSLQAVASQSAKDVAALGTAATPEERGQARIDALNASFAKGEISADILSRSVQGVRDDTEKSAKGMEKYSSAAGGAKNTLGDLMRINQGIHSDTEESADSMEKMANHAKKAADEAERIRDAQLAAEADRVARAVGRAETAMGMFVDSSIIASSKLTGMAVSAQNLASALEDASYHAKNIDEATYRYDRSGAGEYPAQSQMDYFSSPNVMKGGSFVADPRVSVSYRGGGTGKRLDTGAGIALANEMFAAQDKEAADRIAAEEELKQSIDKLASSTDDLNRTNQELLSPYYTMDPRTSHIGFRSQGMASGGYVDVPGGASANDNMMAMVPVASGERIYVDPMTSRRGGGGGSINISAPMTFTGNVNPDQVGRTVFQAMQSAARQIRAASQ